jgi:hypothetical protein
MRLSEMTRHHPAQIERVCSECGEIVGIYPSGQNVLKHNPNTKIICSKCITVPSSNFNETILNYPAAPLDEIIKESKESYDVNK